MIAIAKEYGEGISGKAVSTYFERARKDPHWNLSNTATENGVTPTKGRTPKTTPRKRTVKKEEDDDEDEGVATPSKKTPLNKVKNGRVTKQNTPRARVPAMHIDEEDDAGDNMIKPEDESPFIGNYAHDDKFNAQEGFHYPLAEDYEDGHYEG